MSGPGSMLQTKPHPLQNYVVSQLLSGTDEETIIRELCKSGVDDSVARNLLHSMRSSRIVQTSTTPSEKPSFNKGLVLGGLLAVVVAGLAWVMINILNG